MGGWGSGSWQSGKDTTSDYRALDVRRLQRDGLLIPGRSFGWSWTRDGETVASIQVRAESVAHLPCSWMWAARGAAVYRRIRHLRVSPLLQAGLPQSAGNQ